MGDYDVDTGELDAYGRRLQEIGNAMTAQSSAVGFDGFRGAVGGSLMADAIGLLQPAWDSKRSSCEKHVSMHPQTLINIAGAYADHEAGATTVIRGFFEGRTA